MKNKEYYFDLLEHWIFSYNKYWEAPLGITKLREDPSTSCEELISYCTLIKSKLKKYKGDKDFTKYPQPIQDLIKSILDIVTDGRELHKLVKFGDREYNHHCEKNGYLSFENNPLSLCDNIIRECKELQEVLQSEEATKDLSKYIGKTFNFEHYEDGSAVIHIKKINEKNGVFSFDGYMIIFETVNGSPSADGVLLYDVEDCKFSDIPRAFLEDPETSAELAEILDGAEETTLEKTKEDVIRCFGCLFEQYFNI